MSDEGTDDVTAIILTGGRSSRMGSDKAALVLGGRSLLQRAVDACGEAASAVVIVGAPGRGLPDVTSALPLAFMTDAEEGAGPLAGIVAGLEAVRSPIAVVVACDMPFLEPALLRLLAAATREGASAAVPVVEGRTQPLCSAVRGDAFEPLRAAFEEGTRAASVLADLPGARLLEPSEWSAADPAGNSFIGVNTPEEWARAETLEAARAHRA